ncbi:MAG: hypothetical protein GC184_02450 [Rhizobiales bacterium]|nr:hypothetical protein [Hyphomicrobiales bacterium]
MSAFFLLLTRLLVGVFAILIGLQCVTDPGFGQASLEGLGIPDVSLGVVSGLGFGLIMFGGAIAVGLLGRFTFPLLMIFWGTLFLIALIHLREKQVYLEQGVLLLMLSSVLLLMACRRDDWFSFDALIRRQQDRSVRRPDGLPTDQKALPDDPHDVFELVEIDMRSDMKADRECPETSTSNDASVENQTEGTAASEVVDETTIDDAPVVPVKRKKKYPAVHSYH